VRLKAELERANQEIALLREEIRIKDARLARINPQRRPHYPPVERMAILELRAARSWSLEQTARTFHVTAATIASWVRRVDEQGPEALVQLRVPVNRFPDFVRYAVQRLKMLCPALGKVKIAQVLARAGLHLSATSIGRMLKEKPMPPEPTAGPQSAHRVVTSKYPTHVWLVDFTIVPTAPGLWCSWIPHAILQQWPFCWWVGVVVDHFSRRAMGVGVFAQRPDCRAACALLGRTIRRVGMAPKYIVCDKDGAFNCPAFRQWVKRNGIKPPRYGAVGRSGSIAIVERLILTLKQLLALLPFIPLRREAFRRELVAIVSWYNECRPHMTLSGKTPDEVYYSRRPSNRRPRLEPRAQWPRGSPCCKPWALVAGKPGDPFSAHVRFHGGRKHLPIVSLKRAA
jgi:transposase InsO family protein